MVIQKMKQKLSLYLDLIRWNRPVGWLLPLWPSLAALWIASYQLNGQRPSLHLLIVFTLGSFLMRSAGCCVNDVADKDFDSHVKRTANRPVTSGKLSQREAVTVGAVLALLAFLLVLTTNTTTILWSFAALAIAAVYPFAKRFISMPQAVLGVAFSFGIPMAFSAVLGYVPPLAWGLLIGNLFWVLAYDTEYAIVDRDDDLKIGMKTSAITLGRWDIPAIMLFYGLYLGIWMALLDSRIFGSPPLVRLASPLLWYATLVAALGQVIWHQSLIKDRSREGCFRAFRVNHWLGFTLFLGIVLAL
jgi:4-hydroxybenzoate polyprenyltransferase